MQGSAVIHAITQPDLASLGKGTIALDIEITEGGFRIGQSVVIRSEHADVKGCISGVETCCPPDLERLHRVRVLCTVEIEPQLPMGDAQGLRLIGL